MSNKITITFPDGNTKEFTKGTTGHQVADSISPALAEQSIAVTLNNIIKDLHYPINEDSTISILKRSADEALELIRHDCAHIMAEAVQELFPGTQVTIGPAIENGFYYDFSREKPFTIDDLEVIEKKMHEIINLETPFIREVWSRDDAIKHFSDIGELYKAEIIKDLPESE